jgi:hypothetical protein
MRLSSSITYAAEALCSGVSANVDCAKPGLVLGLSIVYMHSFTYPQALAYLESLESESLHQPGNEQNVALSLTLNINTVQFP